MSRPTTPRVRSLVMPSTPQSPSGIGSGIMTLNTDLGSPTPLQPLSTRNNPSHTNPTTHNTVSREEFGSLRRQLLQVTQLLMDFQGKHQQLETRLTHTETNSQTETTCSRSSEIEWLTLQLEQQQLTIQQQKQQLQQQEQQLLQLQQVLHQVQQQQQEREVEYMFYKEDVDTQFKTQNNILTLIQQQQQQQQQQQLRVMSPGRVQTTTASSNPLPTPATAPPITTTTTTTTPTTPRRIVRTGTTTTPTTTTTTTPQRTTTPIRTRPSYSSSSNTTNSSSSGSSSHATPRKTTGRTPFSPSAMLTSPLKNTLPDSNSHNNNNNNSGVADGDEQPRHLSAQSERIYDLARTPRGLSRSRSVLDPVDNSHNNTNVHNNNSLNRLASSFDRASEPLNRSSSTTRSNTTSGTAQFGQLDDMYHDLMELHSSMTNTQK